MTYDMTQNTKNVMGVNFQCLIIVDAYQKRGRKEMDKLIS